MEIETEILIKKYLGDEFLKLNKTSKRTINNNLQIENELDYKGDCFTTNKNFIKHPMDLGTIMKKIF